jgi:hypothetical protein
MKNKHTIYYYDNVKYILATDMEFETKLRPGADIVTEYITLRMDGLFQIARDYPWNGANFIVDTKHVMPASLFHDAGVDLVKRGLLPGEMAHQLAEEFERICVESGMEPLIAHMLYEGLDHFGDDYCSSIGNPQILTAP